MDLPKGLKIVSDPSIKSGTVEFRSNKTVCKIENIKCPVVKKYNKLPKGPERIVERIPPDPKITNIKYDPSVSLRDADRQYVGINNNTVYRYLGKRYGK
jgi:hypothetical protein